jgi:signal transduction histidine kinase
MNAAQSRTKMTIQCQVEGEQPLPEEVHIAFYRIAQESLNNIIKHSQATQAHITLSCQPEQAVLRIRDNGQGFSSKTPTSGFGLGTMRERAQMIGASLEIISERQQGTEITVRWSSVAAGTGQVG